MSNDPTTLAAELATYAARVVRLIRQAQEQPGARVLSLVDQLGPQTITALAHADSCSQPTMSGAVADLVARGWVSKQPNPADARSSVIGLTAAGRAALEEVRRHNGALLAQRLTGHSPEQIAVAVAVLRSITEPTTPEGQS